MNKYYQILGKVLSSGKMQSNKKGNIRYLLNEQLTLLLPTFWIYSKGIP